MITNTTLNALASALVSHLSLHAGSVANFGIVKAITDDVFGILGIDIPPGPGVGWRFLHPNERVREGDEVRSLKQRQWLPAGGIGSEVGPISRMYRRRIPAPVQSVPEQRFCWVIEARGGLGDPIYRSGRESWTGNINDALQFERKIDAERMFPEDRLKVAEHGFISRAPKPEPIPGDTDWDRFGIATTAPPKDVRDQLVMKGPTLAQVPEGADAGVVKVRSATLAPGQAVEDVVSKIVADILREEGFSEDEIAEAKAEIKGKTGSGGSKGDAKAPLQYRPLDPGETLQRGDEYLNLITNVWNGTEAIGHTYTPGRHGPMRRRVP